VALNIKDETTDRLVRELAAETGETFTTAVTIAVRERLERLQGAVPSERRLDEVRRIVAKVAEMPVFDDRPADEILGYDERGLPT